MKIAPIADVKAKLSEYVAASQKGPIVITKNGKPAAALVAIGNDDDLEMILLANSPRLQKILERSERSISAGKAIPHDDFWRKMEARSTVTKRKNTQA